ncbi:MAG: 4-hydroxy-tetrahydrodipicolinate synthase [Clostridiales bacterium]|jgi:4-hydroxy-tetrahydrodipicolinate synthase|nr:4-hydroxy-tetrahydrodipicolinate synthase [Clostridiales bacterium]
MSIFIGCGVAAATPFDNEGKVNYNEYEKFIDYLIKNGADAIISCGTTGESATLEGAEDMDVIRCAVTAASGRVPVIAGTGSNNTEFGVRMTRDARKTGADACLIVTPYYNKTTQRGLVRHFTTLASATELPVILYNVPSRTGLNIAPSTARELSKVDNIVALKEASGDISQIAEVAELCGDALDIYSGNDDQIIPILSLGGKGVISVLANVAPRRAHDICAKFFAGDAAGGLKEQLAALDLVRALFCETSPIPVKEALNTLGWNFGKCRMPLIDMEDKNRERLVKAMENYGLLPKSEG